ncbi:MAG TPA: hypothetical protein PLL20_08735 [Phycisphaerae bacterium]|nr:hypothetical protein [Phycisphaerae bacterium]HRR87359.1 hypothetical protein [Phycisphaerae bacterium]
MSDLRVNSVLQSPPQATAAVNKGRPALRKAVGEVVGTVFYGPMLRIARNSRIEGKYGHGGRGEKVFQAQLDQEFLSRAGGRMRNSLTEAICSRLAGGKEG